LTSSFELLIVDSPKNTPVDLINKPHARNYITITEKDAHTAHIYTMKRGFSQLKQEETNVCRQNSKGLRKYQGAEI
jgi:hypothetical protein